VPELPKFDVDHERPSLLGRLDHLGNEKNLTPHTAGALRPAPCRGRIPVGVTEGTYQVCFKDVTGATATGGLLYTILGGPPPVRTPADFDGDRTTDHSIFRPSNGTWYIRNGPVVQFGANGDIPAPGDYDGDGKTDVAVFRGGTWFTFVGGVTATTVYGTGGDVPEPGDYKSDGMTDLGLFRPSTGLWFTRVAGVSNATAWGGTGDVPLPLPAAIRQVFFP